MNTIAAGLAETCAAEDEPSAIACARELARRAEVLDPGNEYRAEFLSDLNGS